MAVVVDTAPILAAANVRDESHELAARLVTMLGRQLVVPEPVAVEADWLLRDRLGARVARAFLDTLVVGAHERVALGPSLFARAVEIDRRYADLDLGLVDASVMAIAEARSAAILTFDFRHFRAAPPPRGGTWRLALTETEYQRARRRG